ncbi:MAG: hypothetical protein AAB929_01485, partial [Patescibacteria group bacterium]
FAGISGTKSKIRPGGRHGLTLPVISIEHLITMKKKSNRPVDKLDIEDLKRIKILRERHK